MTRTTKRLGASPMGGTGQCPVTVERLFFFTYVILKKSKVGEMGDFLTTKLLYI